MVLEGTGTGRFGACGACLRGSGAPNLRFPKFRDDLQGMQRHRNPLNLLTGRVVPWSCRGRAVLCSCRVETRRDETRRDETKRTRRDETRRDKTRRDETRRDETRQTRRDETRRDGTRRDEARRDETRRHDTTQDVSSPVHIGLHKVIRQIHASATSNSDFCGLVAHVHCDKAQLWSSNPQFCGLAFHAHG